MRLPEWVRRLFTYQPSTSGSAYYPGWISPLLAAADYLPYGVTDLSAAKPRVRVPARTERVLCSPESDMRIRMIYSGEKLVAYQIDDMRPVELATLEWPPHETEIEMFCQG